MLLTDSIASFQCRRVQRAADPAPSPAIPELAAANVRDDQAPTTASVDGCQMLHDDVAIGLEPFAILDELAALDGPHLHPAAAFMVLRRHLERRHHTAEG